jgi:hypothetical protein
MAQLIQCHIAFHSSYCAHEEPGARCRHHVLLTADGYRKRGRWGYH